MVNVLIILVAAFSVACAPELETEGGTSAAVELQSGEAIVDATSEDDWVGFDLDSGEQSEDGWDVGFQRFRVRLNPDTSVEAGIYPGEDFDPESFMWLVDDYSNPEEPFYVFQDENEGWFDYNLMGHVVTPKERDYVVKSDEGRVFKIRILSYYDEAGTSAIIQFSFEEVETT